MSEEEIIKKANELLTRVMSGYGLAQVDKIHLVLQGLLDINQKEKEKNKALKEGLKYRINYCKLLEKELYANGVNYEFEKTEIEKQFLEE